MEFISIFQLGILFLNAKTNSAIDILLTYSNIINNPVSELI